MYKNIDFDNAQFLSNKYDTYLSNDSIEKSLLEVFGEQFPSKLIKDNKNLKPREFLNEFILRHYPNETSVKSTFLNNVLFKTNNHVSMFELNVGSSRLDLCKINGFSTAFEIKTELDTTRRLQQQMKDYFEVFENVYLICSEQNYNTMLQCIPEECGVYTYYITKTGRYIFKKQRRAIRSDRLSPFSQLSVLTKKDLNIFYQCPNLESKDAMARKIIESKTEKEINKIFKRTLKIKYSNKWNFLVVNKNEILEIDYQWFFKNLLPPEIVYL